MYRDLIGQLGFFSRFISYLSHFVARLRANLLCTKKESFSLIHISKIIIIINKNKPRFAILNLTRATRADFMFISFFFKKEDPRHRHFLSLQF